MNNLDPNLIQAAGKTKDPKKLLNSLSQEDQKKVNDMLSDKEALTNLLKSPEAMAILKMLSGKDKNG